MWRSQPQLFCQPAGKPQSRTPDSARRTFWLRWMNFVDLIVSITCFLGKEGHISSELRVEDHRFLQGNNTSTSISLDRIE